MRTSDLTAQTVSIAVAAIGMVIAWLLTRRCPRPVPPAVVRAGTDAERPL